MLSSPPEESTSVTNLFTGVSPCKDITPGMWILVKLSNAKTAKYYIATVDKVYVKQQECDVMFLKQYRSTATSNPFVKPDANETFVAGFSDIVGKPEDPQQLRRGVLQFNVNSNEWHA